MFTFTGCSEDLVGLTICPDLLKRRSEAELVAQTYRRFCANSANTKYDFLLFFHHFNGEKSLSISLFGRVISLVIFDRVRSLDSASAFLFRKLHISFSSLQVQTVTLWTDCLI